MPILLKKVLDGSFLLNEGVNIFVSGHNYDREFNDLNDVAWWIQKRVMLPIMDKMSAEEKKNVKHDVMSPDGDAFHAQKGTLNVYIGMFPEQWRPRIIGGIDYFLKTKGIKTGKWTQDTSGFFNGEATIRIPVLEIPSTTDPAGQLSITGTTANHLKQILDIGGLSSEPEFSISPQQLLSKIRNFEEEQKKGLAPLFPNIKYFHYIAALKDMAKWAIKHGKTEIVAS